MLSAVENFSPSSATAAHPYGHHSPFSIAAAAAAAGSAAAAAAAVIPASHPHYHHHHQSIKSLSGLDHQFSLNHSAVYSNSSVTPTNNHITNFHLGGGIFLPPPPPPTLSLITPPTTPNILPVSIVLSSKCSPHEQQANPTRDKPPQPKASSFQGLENSCPSNMSSAEFVRPHPKQPRYTNNNNIINNHSSNNNNNYNSNTTPFQLRSTKVTSNIHKIYNSINSNNVGNDKNHSNNHSKTINVLNTNNENLISKGTSASLPRTKYSNEQTGPVNLVTTNNSSSLKHANDNCRTPPTSLISEKTSFPPPDGSDCSRKQIPPEVYSRKVSFATQSLDVTSNAAAAAAAVAYQYNYPHIYNSRGIYGTPAIFSGHHHTHGHHNTLRPCPTYLGSHHEAFTPYLQAPSVYQTTVSPNIQSQSVNHIQTTPQVLPTNNIINTDTCLSSPLERGCSYNHPTPKEITNTNGTYLNRKVNTSPAAPESVSGFKVPTGKEGSLKHRILTRPPTIDKEKDKDRSKRKSPITASIVRSSSNSATSNFTKGSCIELANGTLRRVEDMRTEDFIQSAEKSLIHQLTESTVVKITSIPTTVIITFSYDRNRSKADVEVTPEHPFFVYGQGWASCNPELTHQIFGLKCLRLQVGDICISLTSRENPSSPKCPPESESCNKIQNQEPVSSQDLEKPDLVSTPQNLSKRLTEQSQSSVTHSTGNHQLSKMGTQTFIPSSQNMYSDVITSAAVFDSQFYRRPLQLHHSYHNRLIGHHPEVTLSSATRSVLSLPPPQSHSAPSLQSLPSSNPSPHHFEARCITSGSPVEREEQPVDASSSRKRRWSAPTGPPEKHL